MSEGTMSETDQNIITLTLLGMSTVEVVHGIFEAVTGLAQILAETITVAELPDTFTRQKLEEIERLLAEAGQTFAAAELVLPA